MTVAFVDLKGPRLGEGLMGLLLADDIVPGDAPSYKTCKDLYSYHPLGAKLVEIPIKLAMSKPRLITIPGSPEERVKKAFTEEWKKLRANKHIFNLHRIKRIYGIGSIALLTKDETPDTPVDYEKLWKQEISFNVLDPLNTAGSLVGNLDPNSPGFLKTDGITVNGVPYHRSRSIVALNEEPIYLEWTASAFGYVGRSVYQRTLYPLKSFVETMRADSLVARKAGVIVAKMEQSGSIIDGMMGALFSRKREVVKDAATGNVIGIGIKENIESLNLQNVNGALDISRKHILDDIAASTGMPALLINSNSYAQGFGEGTEDRKAVADFVEGERSEMAPSFEWMDNIVQWRAWNPEFYQTIQNDYPDDYADVTYKEAFYRWQNAFTATWESLLTEPDSEKVKVADTKLKALIALVEILLPELDPDNKATVIQWCAENFNSLDLLFDNPLILDYEALAEYVPPAPPEEPHEPKPFAAQDSVEAGKLKAAIEEVLATKRRIGRS